MIEIKPVPNPLLIENTDLGQYLSLDFLLKNTSDQEWEIRQLDVSVISDDEVIVIRRSLNTNGIRPGLEILGETTIEKQSQLCVYNPFHTFPYDLKIRKLQFVFDLRTEAGDQITAQVEVEPEAYEPRTELSLPMSGRLIVLDGHDYYSHHRRVDLTHPFLKENMGLETNSGRYASDFCAVNENGDLFRNEGQTERDWFGFGESVFSPGAGVVVKAENDMEDNILGEKDFDFARAADDPHSIMGNCVIIDHLNGEYSLLAHLKQGSILVEEGEAVEQGQPLGKLGFSGSTGPWVHLHYELRTGIDLRTSRGLPAYFRNFIKSRNAPTSNLEAGYISSGEIVENLA